MKKENIIKAIEKELAQTHPELKLVISTKEKINNTIKETVTFVPKEDNKMFISPIIYLDDILEYRNEKNITEEMIAKNIIRILDDNRTSDIKKNINELLTTVDKTKIIPELINLDSNKDMLKNIPYRVIADDLALVARYNLTEDGSTIITKDLAEKLHLSEKEILDTAILNTESKVEPMYEKLAQLVGISIEEAKMMSSGPEIIVVSNESGSYGAPAIYLDELTRQKVAKIIDNDYYIIPSSIHECLCVSADSLTIEEANDMITEVNAGELLPEEVLSDHCYLVDAKTLEIINPVTKEKEEMEKEVEM